MPRFPPETSATRSTAPLSLRSSGLRIHRPRSGDGVELVRVVEDGRFCGLRGAGVVVRADGVQNLGENGPVEPFAALLDQAQAEVDVSEELALGGRKEERAAVELSHAP